MGYFQGDTCHDGKPERVYPECRGKVFRQPKYALFLLTVTTDKEFKSGHLAPICARRQALDVGYKSNIQNVYAIQTKLQFSRDSC